MYNFGWFNEKFHGAQKFENTDISAKNGSVSDAKDNFYKVSTDSDIARQLTFTNPAELTWDDPGGASLLDRSLSVHGDVNQAWLYSVIQQLRVYGS